MIIMSPRRQLPGNPSGSITLNSDDQRIKRPIVREKKAKKKIWKSKLGAEVFLVSMQSKPIFSDL